MMRTMMTGLAALMCAGASVAAPASVAAAQPPGALDIDDSPFGLGTLSEEDGALAPDLWAGADAATLRTLLDGLPRAYAEPAYLDLARRLLLSPTTAPGGADDALAGAKLLAAAELGYYREAGQLAELAPRLSAQPALTKVAALSALLDGDVRRACSRGARLTQGRADLFFLRLRYLCYVDAGEDAAADLTLGLLRNQGLPDGADRVFTALQTSSSLGGTVSPSDAFEYAGVQMLGAEVGPAAVPELPGSVLAAVARDEDAQTDLRLPALERALSLGLIGANEGQRLAAQMAETTLAADVVAVATERPGTPASAAMLARSLRAADDYDAYRARAILHRAALRASGPARTPYGAQGDAEYATGTGPDPALTADSPALNAADAEALALGAVVAGEAEAARRWLGAARPGPDADPVAADAIRSLLALSMGRTEAVSVPLADPLAATDARTADLVADALTTARSGSQGAAALVALTGLGVRADGEANAIREAVVLAMLDQSGLAQDVARRAALDIEAAAVFAQMAGGGGAPARSGDPVPRMKPGQ